MKYEEFSSLVEAAMRGLKEDSLFTHPPEGIPFEDWWDDLAKEMEKRVCGPSS